MNGARSSILGADGVKIGLLTAGAGRPLLLVHGGMGRLERWAPMWSHLADRWRVTAMDRRGRGSSGDSEPYSCSTEFEDIAAVGAHLADGYGSAIDVFAHSIGATFTLGAAATSNHFRRIALYEPPGPETVSRGWTDSVSASIANGQAGRAAFRFFTEIVGLTREQVEARRDAPGDQDVLAIVAATMPREARALEGIDLVATARAIGSSPVLLLLGSESPSWAREITTSLAEALAAEVVSLPGQGHEAIDGAPELVLHALDQFFDGDSVS